MNTTQRSSILKNQLWQGTFLLLVLSLSLGCAPLMGKFEYINEVSDSEPYVMSFLKLAGKDAITKIGDSVKLHIYLDETLDSYKLGYCVAKKYEDKQISLNQPVKLRFDLEIKLNAQHWPHLEPMLRQQLLFHELGHCVLQRNHDDSLITLPTMVTLKKSVMNSVALPSELYKSFNKYYDAELINPSTSFDSAVTENNNFSKRYKVQERTEIRFD